MSEIPTVHSSDAPEGETLMKSRQRVADHGEVFTTSWMVQDMLDLVKDESERLDSRFLELWIPNTVRVNLKSVKMHFSL
jgi:hypothetical protein